MQMIWSANARHCSWVEAADVAMLLLLAETPICCLLYTGVSAIVAMSST
jgi:hypothetical protein